MSSSALRTYKDCFEKEFIKETERFYTSESNNVFDNNPFIIYMRKVISDNNLFLVFII